MRTINLELYDTNEDVMVEHRVPAKWVICHRCDGNGTHVNPNVDGHGISPEEFDEDPDFRENYFAGVYDVRCDAGCTDGKALVPNEEAMNPAQKQILKQWEKEQEDKAREEADDRHTMRMENGGYD